MPRKARLKSAAKTFNGGFVLKSFIRSHIKRRLFGKYSIQKAEQEVLKYDQGDAKADDRFAHGGQPLF